MFQPGYRPHPGFYHYPGCLSHAKNPRRQKEKADIRLGFESFAINGDHVTCAMGVKAPNRFSGEPISFRFKSDGRFRDCQLVSAANAIDYRLV